jgi:hypothetical protein
MICTNNNYLKLLSDDVISIIFNKVADLYEKDILLIDNKLKIINNKLGLYRYNKRLYRLWFTLHVKL